MILKYNKKVIPQKFTQVDFKELVLILWTVKKAFVFSRSPIFLSVAHMELEGITRDNGIRAISMYF